MFKLLKQSKKSGARLGQLKTAHGEIETPFFMPIATKAAVKNLTPEELKNLGAEIILSNTYHLFLQPGLKVLKKAGGLHKFMAWDGPILTDSGGFQVFSLAKIRKLVRGGVEFQSHLDGSRQLLTPKKVLQIQKIIGSDIAMILDVCPPSTANFEQIKEAVATTTGWAQEAAAARKKIRAKNQLVFAIIQGGLNKELRQRCLKELVKLNFDGYAIGGLAVGESNEQMYEILNYLAPKMPKDKPRYLMGVGRPENIVEAVRAGIDMFDCVIPTREARHGRLYLWQSSKSQILNSKQFSKFKIQNSKFYKTINISNSKYKNDFSAINQTNLKNYTKAYLYHLFKTQEPLALRLATLNNLDFYLTLMKNLRTLIEKNKI